MPVDAIILPGWMERDFAIRYLLNDCIFDPPLTEQRAESIWRPYRERVEALPERDVKAPDRLALTPEEQRAADQFMEFHRRSAPRGSVHGVIKIDPTQLVAHQFYVVLDKAREYMDHASARTWCARNCLATGTRQHPIRIHHGLNAATILVPHGEFAFIYNQPAGRFDVTELARHVSVTAFQERMILWAGYHRSYARMASANPDGNDRSLLVALTSDADFFVSERSPNQGLRAMVCGPRPSLFGDFFDERFFMRVRLRRKRFELQVRAQVVAVNDE